MFIDDEPSLRSGVQAFGVLRGFTVLTAADGVEGLEVARSESVDAVVVDLHMPGMDGPAFHERLRRERPGLAARTVFKELRRRKSQHRLFDPSCSGDVDGPAPASESREVSIRSALRRVRLHLDALDPVKAWTVVLHDAWGYDLREIAEITDVSVAAAQSRLVRGRADLQARLDGDVELADVLERTEEEA